MAKLENTDNGIQEFLKSPAFAVIGASANRDKYGNKVLRCYLQHGKTVFPVNPKLPSIEGIHCLSGLGDLPQEVKSISIVTPPKITEEIVKQAILKNIENIWMQPGAESAQAVRNCQDNFINVIAGGPCILQVLGFNE